VWTVGAFRSAAGCCDALVTRIDPATNSVVDAIAVPSLTEGDVWVNGSDVYVLRFTASEGGSSTPLELVKVDATDHTIEWRVPIPGQWSQTVFVASGSAWVLGTQPDARGPIEVDSLYRLDPETGAVLDHVPLPYPTFGYIPAVSPETVWLLTKGGIQRFDTASASFLGDRVAPARVAAEACSSPTAPVVCGSARRQRRPSIVRSGTSMLLGPSSPSGA
jgi:hypothetical protein